MNSILPEDIRSLLTEACSLEYCPAEFREWAATTLSTGSAAALINMPDARWRNIRVNLYWAVMYGTVETHARRQLMASARAALDAIKRDHDNPGT